MTFSCKCQVEKYSFFSSSTCEGLFKYTLEVYIAYFYNSLAIDLHVCRLHFNLRV